MINTNLINFLDATEIATESLSQKTLKLNAKTTKALTENDLDVVDNDKRLRLIRKMLFELTEQGFNFSDSELIEELNKYQP
jgi:hypothetical protein